MEYALPIRVRWDVDFRGTAGRTKRIARRIREAGPLLVELRIEGRKGLSDLTAILSELSAGRPRIAVTMGLFPGASDAVRWAYPVDLVWDVGRDAGFGSRLPADARALSFGLDEETIPLLSEVLGEFVECGAEEIHLPNLNAVRSLAERGHVPIVRPEQVLAAAETIAGMASSLDGRRFVVHDYFLWKAIGKVNPLAAGPRVEFSGCQAGSALAYVDWEGNVYPCDALPIRLGTVEESPFERIWRLPARVRLLASLRSMPSSCGPCGESGECFSGCRGLTYLSTGSFDHPDPGCTRRTEKPGA